MKTKKITTIVAGLLLLFLISNCKKQESPNPIGNGPKTENPTIPPNPYTPPAVTFSATVLGFVVDENNNPIQNAVVSTGTKTFTTDENGAFELSNAPFTGDFCYIKATKKGYFFGSVTVQGKAGGVFSTQLVMLPQNSPQTFDAAAGKEIEITGGAKVKFLANAIKTLDDKPCTGNVNVASVYLNPTAANFAQVTPGGDLRAYNAQGQDVMLYSYGMVGVELRDDAGNQLQLADGQKADISMPVPTGMQGKAPATIPLWYFDENKGVWIEEGEAKLQNGKYVGTVSHFTYWNCDVPGNRAKLKGKVRDCEGDVVQNLLMLTGQTNAWVDSDGNWERWVPTGIEFEIGARDLASGATMDVKVPVPSLADEQVKDMGVITVPCRQKVRATVSDCNNSPLNGYAIIKTATRTFRGIIENGRLGITVFSNSEAAELFIHNASIGQLYKVSITLPAKEKSIDIGSIIACPSKSITPIFSFDYDDGSGVKTVKFDNMKNANSVLRAQNNILGFSFLTNAPTNKNTSFGILSPKVGTIPSHFTDSFNVNLPAESKTFYGNGGITFVIQKYEAAGGEVSGTFSGTMMLYNYSGTPTNKLATITNGKFVVMRLPDE